LDGRRHNGQAIIFARHITGLEAGVWNSLGRGLARLDVLVGDDDAGTFACKQARYAKADALRAAGDNDDFVLNSIGHEGHN